MQTVNDGETWVWYQKGCSVYNKSCTFVSPIYSFSLAENVIAYTPIQGTIEEKYFNHITNKVKNADSSGKQLPFRPSLLS